MQLVFCKFSIENNCYLLIRVLELAGKIPLFKVQQQQAGLSSYNILLFGRLPGFVNPYGNFMKTPIPQARPPKGGARQSPAAKGGAGTKSGSTQSVTMAQVLGEAVQVLQRDGVDAAVACLRQLTLKKGSVPIALL